MQAGLSAAFRRVFCLWHVRVWEEVGDCQRVSLAVQGGAVVAAAWPLLEPWQRECNILDIFGTGL